MAQEQQVVLSKTELKTISDALRHLLNQYIEEGAELRDCSVLEMEHVTCVMNARNAREIIKWVTQQQNIEGIK